MIGPQKGTCHMTYCVTSDLKNGRLVTNIQL